MNECYTTPGRLSNGLYRERAVGERDGDCLDGRQTHAPREEKESENQYLGRTKTDLAGTMNAPSDQARIRPGQGKSEGP
jgi:hypothetical protein